MDKTGILKLKNEMAFIYLNRHIFYNFLKNRLIKLKFFKIRII
jgi:hypothetical protein